jgi:hypothetical protein
MHVKSSFCASHEHVWGNGCIAPPILELVTWWTGIISLTLQPDNFVKKTVVPTDGRPAGLQGQSRHFGNEKNLLPVS